MTTAKKKPARRAATRTPSPAEAAPIWEDGDGQLGTAPLGARAARRVRLGDGIAALTIDDADAHRGLLARHRAAWRIERRDGSVTMLVRHRGPSMTVAGARLQTTGTVDVGGAGVVAAPGELPELRWWL